MASYKGANAFIGLPPSKYCDSYWLVFVLMIILQCDAASVALFFVDDGNDGTEDNCMVVKVAVISFHLSVGSSINFFSVLPILMAESLVIIISVRPLLVKVWYSILTMFSFCFVFFVFFF